MSLRAASAFVLVAIAVAACSSTTTGTGTGQPSSSTSSTSSSSSSSSSGGTAGTVSSTDCRARCAAKAAQCGQDGSTCPSVCAAATREQLECLESKPCFDLANASSFDELCPSGATAGSCTTSSDCSGFADCTCGDGSTQSWYLECIGGRCAPDCATACQ